MKKVLLFLAFLVGCASPDLDVIIENGSVVDGSGKDRFAADVGIRDGRIDQVGDLSEIAAGTRVDATGMIVAPGFIDIHSHATGSSIEGSSVVRNPNAENYVRQGVTTAMGGQDGSSMLDIDGFLHHLDANPPAINIGVFVGHGSVRGAVVGQDDRVAESDEMEEMTSIVRRAMESGAFGLSSGLEYTPGAFADVGELIELSKPVAEYGGMYISHIRDEGGHLLESVTEVLDVGRGSGVRVQVTHHKLIGKSRWGAVSASLALLDEAIAEGVDASSDQYPYTASSTSIRIVVPNWAKDGGFDALKERLADPETYSQIRKEVIHHINIERGADPATIVAARCAFDESFNGKSLADILSDRNLPVDVPGAADVALELIEAGDCSGVFHSMSPDDVITVMQHPMTSISSDGGIPTPGDGVPHPRNYGAFARVLGHYVRQENVLTLEQAIYKMTSLPASRLNLNDRGKVAEGYVADIAIFDPNSIIDTAKFGDPHHYATGVKHVLVSGTFVLMDSQQTKNKPGVALRHVK
ncbi:MAG: D-aminoacylase [Rhodothermales bacterium]|nr:D-aminoacylase [Rhodothermales bacterium]MDG2016574.1 D-aminoacylase [Rhodothermales bacterium]